MNFYKKQHHYYCGIDLHARKMYVCIIDKNGKTKVHQNIKTNPEDLLKLIKRFVGKSFVLGVECVFCWYWIADFCEKHNVDFVLGHALYMKAIHGGKTKNDKIDSYTIAALLRGGNFPVAYAYPSKLRATRDLLRRRMYLSRCCSELVVHIQNTNTQYNLPRFRKKISRKYNRQGVAERFEDPSVRKTIEVDLAMIDAFNKTLSELEWFIEKTAKHHDYQSLYLLRSIPGVGQILALVIMYEINDVRRFPTVQDFSSYARLIRPKKESDGKWAGVSNKKIGNSHLKYAIKEASIIFIRSCVEAKKYVATMERKYNKAKALGIPAHKLGRAIYFILKNKEPFQMNKFFAQ